MNRKLLFLLIGLGIFGSSAFAQSSVWFRNNSHLRLEVRVVHLGATVPDTSDWILRTNSHVNWQTDQELYSILRDSTVLPVGDSAVSDIQLIANGDTAHLYLQVTGTASGSLLKHSVALPGQADVWRDDGGFHEIQGMMAGKMVTLKYHPDNDDSNLDRDVRFVLHEFPDYVLDSADFGDANVLNVMSYNVQFLPLFIGGFDNNLRAGYIPDRMSAFQDVVIVQEAFDPLVRGPEFTPGMQAAGFAYNSGILNDFFPFNGGVIIYSRWPIEETAELDFALCGPNSGDCFANKGIKYARINKLGKRYHVFGTHMDAGSGPDDLEAKNLQFAEMRDFIAAQDILPNEAVIYGGDFNVSPVSSANLYPNMLDSLHPVLPDYKGFHCSTMAVDTGKIIDNCWADPRYLLPLQAENEIITLRGIEDDMWNISDLSDHRTCLGRFAYPDISFEAVDTALCLNDSIRLSVSSDIALSYQWYHDGQPISLATSPTLTVILNDTIYLGDYVCQVEYSITRGTLSDRVNQLFFPNGPQMHTAMLDLPVANIDLDAACGVSLTEELFGTVQLFPNPSAGKFLLDLERLPGPADLTVMDLNGRAWYAAAILHTRTALDLSGLPAGIYLLKVSHRKGQLLEKLVVTRN